MFTAVARALGNISVKAKLSLGFALVLILTCLIAFTGWCAVGLRAPAAGITLALRRAPSRRPLWAAAVEVSAALLAAARFLFLDVIGGLLPGLGCAISVGRVREPASSPRTSSTLAVSVRVEATRSVRRAGAKSPERCRVSPR